MTEPTSRDDAAPPTEPTKSTAQPAPPTAESTPAQPTSRWDRVRPHGRIGQVAGILVAVAAAVFIVGSIFVAGFALGSEGGDDEHHGHGGDRYSQSEGGSGDSEQDESHDDGSGHQDGAEQSDGSDDSDGGGSAGHG